MTCDYVLPKKKRKTPVQKKKQKKNVKRLLKKKTKKKRCNMKNCIALHYFLVSVSSFVALWFVFLDSVSVLQLNFVFLCVCFRLGMLTSVLGFVFFCFGFIHFYFCCCCCCLVVFCFYRSPYIFDSSLHLNPTTGVHFKTLLKISSQISNRSGKK